MSDLSSVRNAKIRPMALRLWLSAIDPGLIRLLSAGRAALALLSIWLVLRTALPVLLGVGIPTISLFGVQAGMILLLFIIDLKPSERKITLWLATVPFAGAILLASYLANYSWLNYLILLLLFFLSYFLRRYGARLGELALVTTVGYYLGFLLVPPPALYIPIVFCVLFSALAVYLWEFVIIPYDPAKFLYRSVRTFYHNVGRGVAAIRLSLDAGEGDPNSKTLQRHYQQVHHNRRVIEGLFSAAVSPSVWSQPRLNQLQEEMFKTERGLELLIEATSQLSNQRSAIPDEILDTLKEGLAVLEDQLWMVNAGEEQQLSVVGNWLQEQIKSKLEEKQGGEWVFSLLRMGIAVRQLAQSVEVMHKIEIAWHQSAIEAPAIRQPARTQPMLFKTASKRNGFALHPTTILGMQAVLATGLAMLAATLLNMDAPNLVFWTAFVVIAGSTGESLRRIAMRVVGVIAGTVIGVALAVILLDNIYLTILLVTICLFLAVYILTISYIWMVFWLNIAILLIIMSIGGAALELLVLRPVSTLLGAAVAAVVVVFVLPIRVQDRFSAALSGFLTEVDRYVEAYVRTLMEPSATIGLRTAELNIDASYKKLELNLPNVIYEYNPLSRAQNRLASQATSLAVLRSYVINLTNDIGGDPGSLASVRDNELISNFQSHIHEAIVALNGSLANQQGNAIQPLAEIGEWVKRETVLQELLTAEAGSVESVRNRALYYLKRIDDTILRIASGLGAQVA